MYSNSSQRVGAVDKQIGELLALVILFQKKIQDLRLKLAGNEEFHSRLAFQLLDAHRTCTVSAEDLHQVINRQGSSKSIQELEGFCRKYTTNGCFSYDEFIKFLTPRTNKILAQRLMIRTYRQGVILPSVLISLLAETFSTAVTMTTLTERLRRQLMVNTEMTHLQILDLLRKCLGSKEKLYYFINASTDGQGDYDFALEEMEFLVYHVRGKCEVEEMSDQQIKEIVCPLDMNYQKHPHQYKADLGITYSQKSKTDYFKTKTCYNYGQNSNNTVNYKGSENEEPLTKTGVANFLKTNYQQTSKNFYSPTADYNHNINKPNFNKLDSRQIFLQPLDENVQTKPPTPMVTNPKSFPNNIALSPYLVLDHYNLPTTKSNNQPHDTQLSVSYGNLYIEKFARGPSQNPAGLGYSKKGYESKSGSQLDNLLLAKYTHGRRKEAFFDEFDNKNNKQFDDSDNMSADSAFIQY